MKACIFDKLHGSTRLHFLYIGVMFAALQADGIVLSVYDLVKKSESMCANTSAHSLTTCGWMPSGPCDLCLLSA